MIMPHACRIRRAKNSELGPNDAVSTEFTNLGPNYAVSFSCVVAECALDLGA